MPVLHTRQTLGSKRFAKMARLIIPLTTRENFQSRDPPSTQSRRCDRVHTFGSNAAEPHSTPAAYYRPSLFRQAAKRVTVPLRPLSLWPSQKGDGNGSLTWFAPRTYSTSTAGSRAADGALRTTRIATDHQIFRRQARYPSSSACRRHTSDIVILYLAAGAIDPHNPFAASILSITRAL